MFLGFFTRFDILLGKSISSVLFDYNILGYNFRREACKFAYNFSMTQREILKGLGNLNFVYLDGLKDG
jgi:hypothetical protein